MYLIWLLHLADVFQGLQQDSRGQGGVPCMEGQEHREAGRRRGPTKAMRHCGKYLKRQRCLACNVSYKGEVSFWSVFSYFYFPYHFNLLMCTLFCDYFVFFCPAVFCCICCSLPMFFCLLSWYFYHSFSLNSSSA